MMRREKILPPVNQADPAATLKPLTCARAAIEKKAENVRILNLSNLSGFTDFFVICDGSSDRQVQAIADSVKHQMLAQGFRLLANEGYSEGRWILMDFGDTVVHIFQSALREFYDLESLWRDAPRLPIPAEFYGPSGASSSS